MGSDWIETLGEERTRSCGCALGRLLLPGMFVGLCGDLGGGKTTFTRGVAAGMGVEAGITSPTFQILREYDGGVRLYHFDFYRLTCPADLLDLDFASCLESGAVVAEWADNFDVPGISDFIFLGFEWTGDSSRRIALRSASGACIGLFDAVSAAAEE
jgi:tRNA threonylcarbamoyladenosine biosynthesis protein TsaE